MASYTTHLRLRKPDPTDPAIIDVINDNMDVIDAVIGAGIVPDPPDPPDPPTPVVTAPTAPTSLMATPGNGRVTLVWFAPADNGGGIVIDYEIQRAVAGGAFAVLQPGVLTHDFQDTGLTNGTIYTYTVRARNSAGYGAAASPVAATPVAPPQAPGIPRALSATVAGDAVTLSWSPPATVPADTYTVKRDGVVVTGATGLQATSYTDSGLAPSTYTYVVFGTNGVGPGPDSAPVTATVAAAEVLVYDAEVAADTPTLHVKLDEDAGGTFVDSSGNGHTGTLGGVGHTNNVPGPLATGDTGALRLGGAAYVSFGDVGDFLGQADFAVGVLVKPDALPVPNYPRIVAKEAYVSATGQNNGWALQIKPDGTPQGAFHAGASSVYLETTTPLSTSTFNHLVLSRSGTTASLILNGTIIASATVALSLADHAQPLTVGAGRTSTGALFNYLNGVVSRVAVYPAALAEARAAAQARAVPLSAVTPPTPVAPPAPTGVAATAGDGRATLAWNAASGAASYVVRWGTTTGVYPNEVQGITSTGHIVTGLTNGTPYFFVVHAENTAGRGPASAQVGATPVATPVVGTTIQAQIDATPTSGTLNIAPGSYDAKDIGTGVVGRAMTIRGGSNVQIWGSDIWASWTGTGPWTSGTGNTFSGVVPAMSMSNGAGNDIDAAPELHWPEQVFIEDAAASPEGWRELQQVDESQVTVGAGQFKLVNRTTDRRVVIGENPAGKRIRVTVRTHLLDVQASDVTITGLSGPTAGAGTVPLDGIRFRHCGPNYQRGTLNWRGTHARGVVKWVDVGYSHGPAVNMYHEVAGGAADFKLQGNYLHHCGMGLDAGGDWNNTGSGVPAWGFVIEDNTIAYCNRYAGNGGWHYAGIKITLWGGRAANPAVMRRNDIHGTVWGAAGAWLDTYTPGWTIGGATEADGNRFHDNEGYGFRNEINDGLDLGSDAMVVRWNKTYNNDKAGIYVDVVKDITVRDNHSAWDGSVWDGTQNGINNAVGIDVHWFTGRGDMAVVDNAGPFNVVVQDNTVVTTSNRLLVAWRRDNGGSMDDASNYGTGNRYAVTNTAGAGTGGAIVNENGVSRWQAYNTVAPAYRYYSALSAWVATKYGGLGRTPDAYFANIAAVQAHLVARQLPTTPGGAIPISSVTVTLPAFPAPVAFFTPTVSVVGATTYPVEVVADSPVAYWRFDGGYAQTVLNDTPAAYWRMNEQSGAAAADSSGNGVTGTYAAVTLAQTGALAVEPTGASDDAVDFNGTTSKMTAGDVLDFAGTAPFALECWVRAATLDATSRRLISKDDSTDGYLLAVSNAAFQFARYGAAGFDQAVSAVVPVTGTWYHVVGSYDGVNLRLVVNGSNSGAAVPSSRSLTNNTNVLTVGDRSSGSRAFDGVIDEVAVYDHALATGRALVHHGAGVAQTAGDTYPTGRVADLAGTNPLVASGVAPATTTGLLAGAAGTALASRADGHFASAGAGALLTAENTMTLECWVRTDATLAGRAGVMGVRNADVDDALYVVATSPSELEVRFRDSTGVASTLGVSVIPGTAHHLAVVYDNTLGSGDLAVYLDGAFYDEADAAGTIGVDRVLQVGAVNDVRLPGLTIDEVAVYTTALSAGRVAAHHAAGAGTASGSPGLPEWAWSTTVFDVTAYGAVGDGVTDDFGPIQEALNAANANGGGIVHVPAGTYYVDAPYAIQIYSKTWVQGAGMNATVVKRGPAGSLFQNNDFDDPGNDNIRFTDITLDGDRFGTGETGTNCVRFTSVKTLELYRCRFKDAHLIAVAIYGNGTVGCNTNITIQECEIISAGDSGTTMSDANGFKIIDNVYRDCSEVSCEIEPGDPGRESHNGLVKGNVITAANVVYNGAGGVSRWGLDVFGTSFGQYAGVLSNIIVEDNYIDDVEIGIQVSGPNISNIVVRNNTVHNADEFGIRIGFLSWTTNDIPVTGNVSTDNAGPDILLRNAHFCTVTDNTFNDAIAQDDGASNNTIAPNTFV